MDLFITTTLSAQKQIESITAFISNSLVLGDEFIHCVAESSFNKTYPTFPKEHMHYSSDELLTEFREYYIKNSHNIINIIIFCVYDVLPILDIINTTHSKNNSFGKTNCKDAPVVNVFRSLTKLFKPDTISPEEYLKKYELGAMIVGEHPSCKVINLYRAYNHLIHKLN